MHVLEQMNAVSHLFPVCVYWHCCLPGEQARSFQDLNFIFTLLTRLSVWGIVCLGPTALVSSFHCLSSCGHASPTFTCPSPPISDLPRLTLFCRRTRCKTCGGSVAWWSGVPSVRRQAADLPFAPCFAEFACYLRFAHHPLLWKNWLWEQTIEMHLITNLIVDSCLWTTLLCSRKRLIRQDLFCVCGFGRGWWDGSWEPCSALPLAPCVRETTKGGAFPREGCCRGCACDGEPTKLSSRLGFPAAFPPHKCALDQNSIIPVKWHGISKWRCFERGVLLFQCFSQSLNTIGLI